LIRKKGKGKKAKRKRQKAKRPSDSRPRQFAFCLFTFAFPGGDTSPMATPAWLDGRFHTSPPPGHGGAHQLPWPTRNRAASCRQERSPLASCQQVPTPIEARQIPVPGCNEPCILLTTCRYKQKMCQFHQQPVFNRPRRCVSRCAGMVYGIPKWVSRFQLQGTRILAPLRKMDMIFGKNAL